MLKKYLAALALLLSGTCLAGYSSDGMVSDIDREPVELHASLSTVFVTVSASPENSFEFSNSVLRSPLTEGEKDEVAKIVLGNGMVSFVGRKGLLKSVVARYGVADEHITAVQKMPTDDLLHCLSVAGCYLDASAAASAHLFQVEVVGID